VTTYRKFDSSEEAAGFEIRSVIQMEKLNHCPLYYCVSLWQPTA